MRPLLAAAVIAIVLATASVPTAAAQGYPFCNAGQSPRFLFGFATLKAQLGATMGDPVECEHPNSANGDTLQKTTTGLAFYRKSTNTPTFTDGWRHWALTASGLVFWEGASVDPPGTAPAVASPPPPSSPALPPRPVRPVICAPREENLWSCLRDNPSCTRDPWWVEWNEVQRDELVEYSFIPGLVTEYRYIEVVWLLWKWPEGRTMLRMSAENDVWIVTDSRDSGGFGRYRPAETNIYINPRFTEVSTWMLADVVAHELRHAADHRAGRLPASSHAGCIALEQAAFQVEIRYLRWLRSRMGRLPSPNDIAARLSDEDWSVFRDIYTSATSDNLNADVAAAYGRKCGGFSR